MVTAVSAFTEQVGSMISKWNYDQTTPSSFKEIKGIPNTIIINPSLSVKERAQTLVSKPTHNQFIGNYPVTWGLQITPQIERKK